MSFKQPPSLGWAMVGTGGHAQQLVSWMSQSAQYPLNTLVWLENTPPAKPSLWGQPILQEPELEADLTHWLKAQGIEAVFLGVGFVKAAPWRAALVQRYQQTGLLHPWVHPTATVAANAVLGAGTVVGAGAVIQPFVQVGAGGIINTAAVVEHHGQLADNVHVGPQACVCGGVTAGPNSLIGAGAVVLQGLQLAANTTVAAGAVIRHSVSEPGQTLRG